MRHEVIKLTDAGLWPQLRGLIASKGHNLGSNERDKDFDVLVFSNGKFIQGKESYYLSTITDSQFLQKYGENTAPEPDKERELLERFVAQLNSDYVATYNDDLEKFLSSIRKPAFELVCQDGVVTDPDLKVYYVDGIEVCGNLAQFVPKDKPCFIYSEAALDYRLNNTPAIKLSDMTLDHVAGSYYWITKEDAHNLVNERIK